LDISVKETSICIVDDTGKIVREVKAASEPEALLKVLGNPIYHFKRIRLEAGALSQWLFSSLAEAGLPVICAETRRAESVRAHGPASPKGCVSVPVRPPVTGVSPEWPDLPVVSPANLPTAAVAAPLMADQPGVGRVRPNCTNADSRNDR
jgi:hypothetical protein